MSMDRCRRNLSTMVSCHALEKRERREDSMDWYRANVDTWFCGASCASSRRDTHNERGRGRGRERDRQTDRRTERERERERGREIE